MDPASVVGLVAAGVQFVDVTVKAFKALSHFINEVVEVPARDIDLQYEIITMVGVMTSLKVLLETSPSRVPGSEGDSLKDTLNKVIEVVEEISMLLEEHVNNCLITKKHRLVWPFKTKEIGRYVDKMQ